MNGLNKVISVIAPGFALKREVAQRRLKMLDSGYGEHGASYKRNALKGFFAQGGSAKEDIDNHTDTLRRRSRELYSGGSAIATAAIKTMRTNVVGRGLRLSPRIDADYLKLSPEAAAKLEAEIKKEFAVWADTNACDIVRRNNFYELQQLAFMNWLLSGDVLALFCQTKRPCQPYDLRIKLVEADRLSTPDDKLGEENINNGIELNADGEIEAYYISKFHPYSYKQLRQKREWTRVLAYGEETGRPNVLHIANDERIGQMRGVPFLSPIIENIKQIGRYTDAELTAAVIAGYFTVFITKDSPKEENPLGEGGIPISEQTPPPSNEEIQLGSGMVYDLAEGENISTASPGRPNTAYDVFVNSIAAQIGAALEIPHEVLLKKFDASYSASRGALLEAWKMFKMYRSWLAEDFCQPIYEEWFCSAVACGRIKAPGFWIDKTVQRAYMGAEWNGPAQGQLDPVKETTAAVKRIENGLSSYSREAMEMNGSDFSANVTELKKETLRLREALGNEVLELGKK